MDTDDPDADPTAMMVRGRKNAGPLRPQRPAGNDVADRSAAAPRGPSRPDRPRPRKPLQPRPGQPAGHPAARRGHARLLAGAHPHMPGVVAVRSPARRSGPTDVPSGALFAGAGGHIRGAVRGGGLVWAVRSGHGGSPGRTAAGGRGVARARSSMIADATRRGMGDGYSKRVRRSGLFPGRAAPRRGRAVSRSRAGPQSAQRGGQFDPVRDLVRQHYSGVPDQLLVVGGHRQPPVPPCTLTHSPRRCTCSCSRYDVDTRIVAAQGTIS